MSDIILTDEQQAAIDASKTGQNIVLTACAGSGKTTNLRKIATANPDRSFYFLAFNRSVRDDAAKSFPKNVKAFTGHQLAFASHCAPYKHRMPAPFGTARRVWADGVARILSIYKPFTITEDESLSPKQQAVIVNETVANFCKSGDREISARNIPKVGTIARGSMTHDRLVSTILPYAKAAWTDLCDRNGKLNYSLNIGLKRWSLTNPTLDCDCVLYDEAQDANGCMAAVVENQTCQIIMVGDAAQAIYGWNGAIDALSNFNAPIRLKLTKSFRFGQGIADRANRWLPFTGSDMQIEGFEAINSTVEPLDDPDAILCRTNAGVIEAAIQQQAAGRTAAIVGGTNEIKKFAKAAERLLRGQEVDHPELIGFKNWSDVQAHAKDEGVDIRIMVKLVDAYGVEAILDVCENSISEDKADVVVSTAHKAKGREWDSVRIGADFLPPKDETGKLSATECMLAYVAVTRAKKILDDTALSFLDQYIQAKRDEA
jgi:hypothetical protein